MRDLLCKKNRAFLTIEDLENYKNEGEVIYNIVRKYTVDGICDVSVISLSSLEKALKVFEEEFENSSIELLEEANYSKEEIEEFINEDEDYLFTDTYGSITLSDNTITMYITVNKIVH